MKHLSTLSLATKLSTLYIISTFSIILSIAIFLYPTYHRMMLEIEDKPVMQVEEHIAKQKQQALLLRECRIKIVIALLLSAIGSIFMGVCVTRCALQKINQLTSTMEKISSHSLDERINPDDWPQELKSLGANFNSLLDRLEGSFAQLSQFSSDIAHELRTPLNNLRGMAEVALANASSAQEYQHALSELNVEFQDLSRLVDSLLFLARVENGKANITPHKTNLRELIDNLFEYYQLLADEKSIQLSLSGEATLAADPLLIKRLISNLLANAIQYTKPHGEISVNLSHNNDEVVITIRDNGIGIAPDKLDTVLHRFVRADTSRSTHSGNLGLGLAIAKSITELHQGCLHIESHVNVGTTITCRFPQ